MKAGLSDPFPRFQSWWSYVGSVVLSSTSEAWYWWTQDFPVVLLFHSPSVVPRPAQPPFLTMIETSRAYTVGALLLSAIYDWLGLCIRNSEDPPEILHVFSTLGALGGFLQHHKLINTHTYMHTCIRTFIYTHMHTLSIDLYAEIQDCLMVVQWFCILSGSFPSDAINCVVWWLSLVAVCLLLV